MIIHHRGIYHDRFDTPFGVGTLIWAKGCKNFCPGCFHQDRFDMPIYEEDSKELIKRVKENPFTNGIVLGGFEWTEQYDELLEVIHEAECAGLEIILYTHRTLEDVSINYRELLYHKGMYIKCGEYDESLLSATHVSYGVPLASTNQFIYKIGEDVVVSTP